MTPRSGRPRVLLVDNHDSYTGSIEQLLWQVTGERPDLVQSDAVDLETLEEYTHIVLGPGPGTPHLAADAGRGLEVLRRAAVPVLGVCFGFQQMAVALGGRVVPAPRPAHGVIETVAHDGSVLFDGVPGRFDAVRYHSLVVAEPAPFRITARATDGIPMAGEAPDRGWYGVQFHPESIGSAHGRRLIENFLAARATNLGDLTKRGPIPPDAPKYVRSPSFVTGAHDADAADAWRVWSEHLALEADSEALFAELYGDAPTAVWLDSAQRAYGMGRYSVMGAPETARDHVLEYRASEQQITIDGAEVGTDLWRELDARVAAHRTDPCPDLPFTGGYVGSVGYGAKGIGRVRAAVEPDAQLVHLSRFIVIDHVAGVTHVVAVGPESDEGESKAWIEETRARICGLADSVPGGPVAGHRDAVEPPGPADPAAASVSRERYARDLAEVRTWLEAGDSYEACYTYRLRFPFDGDAFETYRTLRRTNPAPYAAYLRLPRREILSCSPERFLAVTPDGIAETKPIKGTARRDADPERDADAARALAKDPKTRAENLMIVDLLRNDLGRISAPGSVEVSPLMAVESYQTVHQLVTSVRSRVLTSGVRAAEALFPPGSMTGAPKQRTVELLDDLEADPRGAYAGVVGFFSRCGAVDLSVVIRTAVVAGAEVAIGTGGAITIDSDPDAELDEAIAKAVPLLRAFGCTHPHE